jgi:uncharacterized protein YgiM (DUF1202 family)
MFYVLFASFIFVLKACAQSSFVVSADFLVLRAGPSTSYHSVGIASKGEKYTSEHGTINGYYRLPDNTYIPEIGVTAVASTSSILQTNLTLF